MTVYSWHGLVEEFQSWLEEQETMTHDGDLLTMTDTEELLLTLFAQWAARRYEPPAAHEQGPRPHPVPRPRQREREQ